MTAAAYALALVLTWLVESAVLVLIVRASPTRILCVSLAVNLLTNPLANWAHQEADLDIALVEGLVWAAEVPLFAWLLRLSVARALLVSLAVNGATAGASLLLRAG